MTGIVKYGGRILLVAVAVSLVGACTSTQCDPSQTNILSAVYCQATGISDRRVAQKQDQILVAQAQAGDLAAEARRLNTERAQNLSEIARLERRLSNLGSELRRYRERLNRARAQRHVGAEKVAQLGRQLRDLQRKRDDLAAQGATSPEVESLLEDVERTFEEMDVLVGDDPIVE